MTTTLLILAITLLASFWLQRQIRAHRSRTKIAAISAYFTEMESYLDQSNRNLNALARESRKLEKQSNPEVAKTQSPKSQKRDKKSSTVPKSTSTTPATETTPNLSPSAPSASPRKTPRPRRQAKTPNPPLPPTVQFQKPSLLNLCITKIQTTIIKTAQIFHSLTRAIWPIKTIFFRKSPDTSAQNVRQNEA